MKHSGLALLSLLSLAATAQAQPQRSINSARIIGGSQDLEHHFVVGLIEEGQRGPFCGATVIEPGLAVTAGHCVKMRSRDLWLVGSDDWSQHHFEAARVKVSEIEIHPDFLRGDHGADIALIKYEPTFLADADVGVQLTPIKVDQPAVLPEFAQVIGWGSRSSYGNLPPSTAQVATVPLIADELCKSLGGRYSRLSSKQLCAGYLQNGGIDSCHGDSGGPLFVSDSSGMASLIGVVSWGESCAQVGHPGVYTRVAAFLDWINAAKVRRPNGTIDPASNAMSELINRRCYHKLHGKLKEAQGNHVLNLFTHAVSIGHISALDTATEPLLREPLCVVDTSAGRYELYADTVDLQHPERQLATLLELGTGRKFHVAINNALRAQLACQHVAPTNGDPMLIADDDRIMVRWHGDFYEGTPQMSVHNNRDSTAIATTDGGCNVGPFGVNVLAGGAVVANDALEVVITVPNLTSGPTSMTLTRVKRTPFMELSFLKADDHSGFLELHNPTEADLLNWRLDCDHHLKFESLSSWPAGRDFEEVGQLSHEYSTSALAWSKVPRGATLRFAYRSESPLGHGAKIRCTINGIPMTVREKAL